MVNPFCEYGFPLLDARVLKDAGWGPSVDLETGLRETVEFCREHREAYL